MKLVVGLGNPGREYDNTRHNIGFMVLDSFLSGFTLEKKFQAMILKSKIGDEEVLFVKPVTFMNLSGNAVSKIVNYYHISLQDILIIQDDLDMELGKIKVKLNSSSGGHNGIKSIINSIGTQNFCRLKIGIAHDKELDTIDYVLQKFSKEEMNFFQEHFSLYQDVISTWVLEGAELAMAKYNSFGGYKHE